MNLSNSDKWAGCETCWQVTIQMIEYDKERQEHLEPGFLEPTVDDNLLTREIPVAIKVWILVLLDLFWHFSVLNLIWANDAAFALREVFVAGVILWDMFCSICSGLMPLCVQI